MIETTGIRVDFPDSSGGTTTTGNVARKLLHDVEVRKQLLTKVPDHLRGNVSELCKRLSVILRIVSSKEKVCKLEDFKQYCQESYKFVLEKFPPPKCYLSPTVHKLIGHGWELIKNNSGVGLGTLSEGGIEASNKLLRRFRINLSRKTDQVTNLVDCGNRLWLRGDPILRKIRDEIASRCQLCSNQGHSKSSCHLLMKVLNCEDEAVDFFLRE